MVTQISNNIEIALLIPDYKQNIPTIISDMNKNGYFKGYERSVLINNLRKLFQGSPRLLTVGGIESPLFVIIL